VDETGEITVVLEAPEGTVDGEVVVLLDPGNDENGEVVVVLDADLSEIPVGPVDEVIYLDVQEYCWPGNKRYKIYLPAQTYLLEPLGGACNDDLWRSDGNAWTWHMACSTGEIGGTYSMLWSGGSGLAPSPEAAYASVVGQFIVFDWPGGDFELWIPANDVGPFPLPRNSGGLSVRLRSLAVA
jgi:hypothetical protein